MVSLFRHVLNFGQNAAETAGTGFNRVTNIPRNVMNMGANRLEDATYNTLMRGADDRAQAMTMARPPEMPRYESEFAQQLANDMTTAQNYQQLADRAKFQSALVPGAMRFAGNAVTHPLAKTMYTVGATVGAGHLIEQQALKSQFAQAGLSPEQSEVLANELAMAASEMPVVNELRANPSQKGRAKSKPVGSPKSQDEAWVRSLENTYY